MLLPVGFFFRGKAGDNFGTALMSCTVSGMALMRPGAEVINHIHF